MTSARTVSVVLTVLLSGPATGFAWPPSGDDPRPAAEYGAGPSATPLRVDPASQPQTEQAAVTRAENSTGLSTLFRDLWGDLTHLPSKDSLVVASVGGGLALAVHPIDDDVNAKLANDGGFFKAGDALGPAVLIGASAATYALGRVTGQSRVSHVGLDLLRAEIVSETMVEALKVSVQRQRPDGSSGYSFPSGHAAAAFAAAAVIQRHHGFLWAIPTYTLATYIATSRLHDNVHYLSDVVFGAAVGTVAGRTVTRHGRSNFAFVPAAVPGGAAILFTRTSATEG